MTAKTPPGLPESFFRKPVIPYLTHLADECIGLLAHASLVMIQADELTDLPRVIEPFERPPLAHTPVLLHLDLIHGLARDEAAVRFVAGMKRINGIITVHHHLVAVARRLGLLSVVRLFLQDGRAVKRGLSVIQKSKPDAVELLPGVAAIEVAAEFRAVNTPHIAGGLIRGPETFRRIIASGCRAVSTTNEALWRINEQA
ncbi:MAG: glycerol-3-phosphate responsive antiterminator [Pirellulales bacterium]|nr:glycerol-3-phosphate responsive antiterminator [Pirellulales bacterium]